MLLIEKNNYPKHKVCGEYISNEVLPYLEFLDINPFNFGAVKIDRFELSTTKGNLISAKLPLGGFGISRYKLDFELSKKAIKNGVTILKDIVLNVDFSNDSFLVQTKENKKYTSKITIGAFVSGMDAGQIYNSWPLMGESYFPNDNKIINILKLSAFSDPSLVQFMHRNLAYIILVFYLLICQLPFELHYLGQYQFHW